MLCCISFCGLSSPAEALRLPCIFGDHMVLQEGQPIPVWGWAEPGETVTVSYAHQTVTTKADRDGQWYTELESMKSSDVANELTIKGSNGKKRAFTDVLIGEVWLCSGQSNMEWPLNRAKNAETEVANAKDNGLRFFIVKKGIAYSPQDDLEGKWVVCSPDTVASFSAVGYFFGHHLRKALGAPVGLIGAYWGGTVAEAWTSADALRAKVPEFSSAVSALPDLAANLEPAINKYRIIAKDYDKAKSVLFEIEDDLVGAATWANENYDDTSWRSIYVPSPWEQAGFPNLDGCVWLRKSILIPQSWEGRDLMLHPGPIDEVDVTWFNGQIVGRTGNIRHNVIGYWNQSRSYTVPGNLVKAGENTLAIRIMDLAGEGGLWGLPPESMYLCPVDGTPNERIPLAGDWKLKPQLIMPASMEDPRSRNVPSVLFNQMISPLIPYGIRGVIWYQGEANVGRAEQYERLLPALISDWRERWGQEDFTFLIVQLANYGRRSEEPVKSVWAEVRNVQAKTAASDPDIGLAVSIDIGEGENIHPANKQDVGTRLGLAAEALSYHRDVVHLGPTPTKAILQGNEVVIEFDNAEGGITSKTLPPAGFMIGDRSGKWVWANVRMQGSRISLSAPEAVNPVAVRYAWDDNPLATLYNQAGLPMAPFELSIDHSENTPQ